MRDGPTWGCAESGRLRSCVKPRPAQVVHGPIVSAQLISSCRKEVPRGSVRRCEASKLLNPQHASSEQILTFRSNIGNQHSASATTTGAENYAPG